SCPCCPARRPRACLSSELLCGIRGCTRNSAQQNGVVSDGSSTSATTPSRGWLVETFGYQLLPPPRSTAQMERTGFEDEHHMFREAFRTFVEREMVPNRERWEEAGIVDRELFTKAGASGFLAMAVPEDLGGAGVH